jgi:hypothetical protein
MSTRATSLHKVLLRAPCSRETSLFLLMHTMFFVDTIAVSVIFCKCSKYDIAIVKPIAEMPKVRLFPPGPYTLDFPTSTTYFTTGSFVTVLPALSFGLLWHYQIIQLFLHLQRVTNPKFFRVIFNQ